MNAWDTRPSGKTVADVDEQTLRDYVARGNACGRISEPFTTAEQVLASLGLLRNGHLTNAADVLFCKFQSIRLKQGMLESHTRTNILDLQQESGTVFDLVRKADLYILNNTRRRFVIEGPGPREEIPVIPREAIREAMLNAYCHMDWAQRGFVIVDIYWDAVEILSPGWFIVGQDPERHLAGIDRDSTTRNELIARTLYRSKEIESYGSGLPRIKELCDAAGIRVEYRRTHDGTLLVFHRNDAFERRSAGLQPYGVGIHVEREGDAGTSLTPDELAVRRLVQLNPKVTYDDVLIVTGFSEGKVRVIIRTLRKKGIIPSDVLANYAATPSCSLGLSGEEQLETNESVEERTKADEIVEERTKADENEQNGSNWQEAQVLRTIREADEPVRAAEISVALGLGKTRTSELIASLIRAGHVVAEGATRSRRYRLADGAGKDA